MRLAAAIIVWLAWAGTTLAEPRFGAHPTPGEIARSVAQAGPRATVDALWEEGRWDWVSERIDAGDAAFVALAPKLAAGGDAATAEDLPIALAFALPRNAPAVLAALASGAFQTSEVCGAPFIEDTVTDIPAYRRRAAAAVQAVADPRLAAGKRACLAALAKID